MTPAAAKILIATDAASDAELVRKLLSDNFDNISISTDPDRSIEDFERRRPEVLVLAFNMLEKAERYYLGLYRLGTQAHAIPHRTVILCNKDDLRRTYELCRRQYFDDYVLFWPATNDAPRLPMAVHHALRAAGAAGLPREVAAQAHRIAELEAKLAQYEALGTQHAASATEALRVAGQGVADAIDGFSQRMADGDLQRVVNVRDRTALNEEFARLKSERVEPSLQAAADAIVPLASWANGLLTAVAPQLEAARALNRVVQQARPAVLVVDDDVFQHRLLAQMLADADIELQFSTSAAEAFAVLRKRRPDVILMDIDLPDMNGIDVMRNLKAVEAFAGIPILMLTGHSERQIVIDSLRAGAAGFIVKPIDKAKLVASIQRSLAAPAQPGKSSA